MATELSPNPAGAIPAGDDCLSVSDGRLWIEDLDATDLARRFGTPLYVMSERQLRANARRLIEVFGAAWPDGDVLIMPSIKANLSIALRLILNEEGTGCDTFGTEELELALRCGVDPARTSLNGPTKDAGLIERAVAAGVRITLDSLTELETARAVASALGKTALVRFRLRPWLDIEAPTELFGDDVSVRLATQEYKPGIPTEELMALPAATIGAPELDVTGLAAHIGRQGRDPELWGTLAEWVGALSGELSRNWDGWRPREIDLGGGFPVPRDPFGRAGLTETGERPLAPSLEAYAEAIAVGLRRGMGAAGMDPTGVQLEIEPGRSLYGNAGLHLARVDNVKSQRSPVPLRWVETDTSEIFLADVLFERNRWNVIAAERVDQAAEMAADVVGRSCNPDVIVPRAHLPEVEAGDVLAFLDTGAYQDANASNFNALPRPGTVLVNGAEAEWIKRPERPGEPTLRDLVPARLGRAPIEIVGLDHVSVTCADLDRSLHFYAGLMGVKVIDRGGGTEPLFASITGLPDASVRWADLDLGRGQVLELLEYSHPAAGNGPAGFHHNGQGHFSLQVVDAVAAHAALVAAGVTVLSEPVTIEAEGIWGGCRCFYVLDPDGMTVELVERRR